MKAVEDTAVIEALVSALLGYKEVDLALAAINAGQVVFSPEEIFDQIVAIVLEKPR